MLAHLPFLNRTGWIQPGKEYLLFDKILAPLDGAPVSETGLTWAHSAASHLGASLELLRIVDTTHHEANGHVADAEEYLKTLHDRISTTPGTERNTEAAMDLTRRELEILRLLTEGVSTSEAAQRLHVSQSTVRNHVQNLLSKLGVHSRLEAVAYATRNRLF